MSEVRIAALPRLYPMPAPTDDPRFTAGLLVDVVDVLETHGYPRPTSGGDLLELHMSLFRFLYTTRPDAEVGR